MDTDDSLSTRTGRSSHRMPADLSEPLTAQEDPFHVFREDLNHKLELVDEGLAEFLRVVYQTDTSVNTAQLKETRKQLKRHMKNAERTLQDVQTTVQVVEKELHKFPHISESELYERQNLVANSRDRLQRAKDEQASEAVKAKLLADERAKAVRRAGDMGARNDAELENTSFIVDSQARTSLLMQQQDDTLDDLDQAVVRVGHMAGNIHDEIGEQSKMLDEMADDLENAEEELGIVMGKLAKFLKTKDRWQLCTILSLSATAMVLFMLVLYT